MVNLLTFIHIIFSFHLNFSFATKIINVDINIVSIFCCYKQGSKTHSSTYAFAYLYNLATSLLVNMVCTLQKLLPGSYLG